MGLVDNVLDNDAVGDSVLIMVGVGCWDNDIVTDLVRELLAVLDAKLLFDCVVVNDSDVVRVTNGVADRLGNRLDVGVARFDNV